MLNEDIQPGYAPKELVFMGYKTHNLHHSADAAKAFQQTIAKAYNGEIKNPQLVRDALIHTDQYMKLNDMHLEQGVPPDVEELKAWRHAHNRAKQDLENVGEFLHHEDYWHMHGHELEGMEAKFTPETVGSEFADSYTPEGNMVQEELSKTLKTADRVKVARVIADMLGVENAESMSPDTAVNQGLRKIKNKRMTPEFVGTIRKMVELAKEVGIKIDTSVIPAAVSEEVVEEEPIVEDKVNKDSTYNAAKDILRFNDFAKLSKINRGVVPADVNYSKQGQNEQINPASDDKTAPKEDETDTVQNIPTQVGYSMTHPVDDQLRRRKVAYKLGEEVELDENKTGYAPGWMLKKDPELAKKIKANTKGYKDLKKFAGKDLPKKEVKLDEISKETLKSYIPKAMGSKSAADFTRGVKMAQGSGGEEELRKKSEKRSAGIHAAIKKLTKEDRSDADRLAVAKQMYDEKLKSAKSPAERAEAKETYDNIVKRLKEDVELEEAADLTSLRKQIDKHTELAVKANKAGDDEAVKKHQGHINAIKDKMARLVRSEEIDLELEEDIHSADFKVNPDTGRKYRARHIEFANSKAGGRPLEGDDEKSDVDYKDKPAKHRKGEPMIKTLPEEFDNEHEDLELSDDELEKMANEIDTEDEVIDAYDEDELCIVDQDTGEVVSEMKEEVEQLDEVLSRMERMRAKIRFARTASKRERKLQIALKTRSSSAKINKRARTLAVKLMKQRLVKKPLSQMTVGEKERAEKIIARRKAVINRLAMKLAPRIRKIENARLSHSKVTK